MKKILLSGIMILALAFTGCKDFLDVNRDPGTIPTASLDLQFPVGQVYSTVALGYTTQLMGSFWSQHYTQNSSANQYNVLINYGTGLSYSDNYMSSQWSTTYRQTIPALRGTRKTAVEMGSNYISYVAVCDIMEAFNWHILNSTYDRICYAEGQQGMLNLEPEFESTEESYQVVLKLFEDILSTYNVNALSDPAYLGVGKDMIFDWDMAAWMKFANTVYLKMLMRNFATNRTKIEAVLASPVGLLDEASGDAKFAHYSDTDNRSNPLYEGDRRDLNTPANIRACNSLLAYLLANNDPRMEAFYEPSASGEYVGSGFSARGVGSRARLAADDPVYFASVAEAYFLKAEAYARLGNAANAKTAYDSAVKAAFNRWGMNGDTFVAAGGPYEFNAAADMEGMIEQIIVQKWVASARCQAWDAWFDLNRTGYPAMGAGQLLEAHPGGLAAGSYPRRFLYPKISYDYNRNVPSPENLNVKLWWHK